MSNKDAYYPEDRMPGRVGVFGSVFRMQMLDVNKSGTAKVNSLSSLE